MDGVPTETLVEGGDYQSGKIFERASSGDGVSNYALNFGMSLSENPTLGIVPMQGDEFTERILSPSCHEAYYHV